MARKHRFGSEDSFCKLLNSKGETVADHDVTLSESLIPDHLERPNALAQLKDGYSRIAVTTENGQGGNAREKLTPFRYWKIDPQGATLGRYPSFSRAAGGP